MILSSLLSILHLGLVEARSSLISPECKLWKLDVMAAFCLISHSHVCCPFFHDAEYNKAIRNYTRFGDWYLWVQMYKGTVSMPVFQSLEAYWPGLQVGTVREGGHFFYEMAKQAYSDM